MKQREKCSGRGCESPQVHHKETSMDDDLARCAVGVAIVVLLELIFL